MASFLDLHLDVTVHYARVQARQGRRRRTIDDIALRVEDAAVAGTLDPFRLAIVGGAATEMRATGLHCPHVLFARTHEIDNRAVGRLRVAVLSRDAKGDRNRLVLRQAVQLRRTQPGGFATGEARCQRCTADDEGHRGADGGLHGEDCAYEEASTAERAVGERRVRHRVKRGKRGAASLAQAGKRAKPPDYTYESPGVRHWMSRGFASGAS